MHRWLAVLALVGGCSFALSGPDPDRPRNQAPRCDTTKGLVVLDGLMATAMGVVALTLVDTEEPAIALLPAAIGALYVGGAIRGNSNVNACRTEMDGFAMGRTPPLPDESEPAAVAASRPMVTAPVATEPPAPVPAVNAQPGSPAPPLVTPPPAPPTAQPPPPAPGPMTMRPRAPAPPPRPAPSDDAWGEFWKEVAVMRSLAVIATALAAPVLVSSVAHADDEIVRGSVVKIEAQEIYVNLGADQGRRPAARRCASSAPSRCAIP